MDTYRSRWNARRVPPGKDLLLDFAGLADGPESRISAFAKKWGVLGICPHNLPSSHALECTPSGWDGNSGWEPITRWRHYAQRAKALLLISSRLQSGEKLWWTKEDFSALGFDLTTVLMTARRLWPPDLREPLDTWETITGVVNEWLALGEVRPRLLFTGYARGGRPRLVLAPQFKALVPEFPLFGVLGMQLAFAVSAGRGMAPCEDCGVMFEPGRQLRPGVRHFCPDCGRPAMQRAASRAYRERERQKVAEKAARPSRTRR